MIIYISYELIFKKLKLNLILIIFFKKKCFGVLIILKITIKKIDWALYYKTHFLLVYNIKYY